jgi:hypothetical protein
MAKFRSWNEDFKFFIYWEDGEYYYIPDIERINPETKEPYKHVISRRQNTETFNWQNAEQSTGLFDNNNKEIFVGDVVKNSKEETAIVAYHSLICGFTVLFKSDGTDKFIGLFDSLEVIGHIHEGE